MSQPAFDFGPDEYADATYSVSDLAAAINGALSRAFRDGVWVRGEIHGISERGAHLYFRLTESIDGQVATIDVAFFAPDRRRLMPLLAKHRLTLAEGLKVRIYGRLDFFAPSGRISLKMSGIDPRFTLGELAQSREELVRVLTADGTLAANGKLAMPPAPMRVGVITSQSSAAWADFRHEIERSGLGFRLQCLDVRVQGDTAAAQVSAALRWFAESPMAPRVHVVALIRGGGSRTDLAAFDTELIARAIAASRCPVLTGLGHEVDSSVADLAAHTHLKTPTACAAHLVERVIAYRNGMEECWLAVVDAARRRLDRSGSRLVEAALNVHGRTVGAVSRAEERNTERVRRLAASVEGRMRAADSRLENASAALARAPQRALADAARHLDAVEAQVRLLDPALLIDRGWSITRDASGRVVRHVDEVAAGDDLHTQVAGGHITSTVGAVSRDDQQGDPR